MEHTRCHRSRLWAGRLLLTLAVLLYGAALMAGSFAGKSEGAGWEVVPRMWTEILRGVENEDWVLVIAEVGLLYANLPAVLSVVTLALGWPMFARIAALGAVSAIGLSFSLAAVVLIGNVADVVDLLGAGRGAWLWVASLHVLVAAAFVPPCRPRTQATD